MAARLTDKQKRFVTEYLVDLNATAAAKRAGYNEKTAYSIGQENLKKPEIQAALKKAMERREKRTEITQDSVLKELAAIGFSNAADFVKVSGGTVKITDTDLIEKEKLPALAGVKETQNGIEIKLHDKVKALELIGKHLGMFDGSGGARPDAREDDALSRSLKELAEEMESDSQS